MSDQQRRQQQEYVARYGSVEKAMEGWAAIEERGYWDEPTEQSGRSWVRLNTWDSRLMQKKGWFR